MIGRQLLEELVLHLQIPPFVQALCHCHMLFFSRGLFLEKKCGL